ncbi:MAG: HAMP domain-containing sensor histidine kinase, partial [Mariprofundaceae bacterium]
MAGLFYLQQHAVFFDQYRNVFLGAAAAYFIYNLLSLPAIKRRPLSAFRTLFAPAFDIAIVCLAAVIDGGHSSGIYFILLVIIFGNSFRYGNALLLYTQALAIIGLIGVAIYTLFNMHLDLDRTLLVWQLAGLLVIPSYIYLIGEKAERAVRGQSEAEEASFSLLDQGPLPVFTYDLDDNNQPRILYANAAISEVFRDDYTRLIGEQPDMLALLEDGEEMLEFCRRSLQADEQASRSTENNGGKKVIYIRGRDRNDNTLRLMCNTTRLRWRNKWIGVCFILDITQREASQAKLESMHRQGYMSAMVAGIVHDFRNILTSMIGYAEVMQMDAGSDIHKDQLQAIIDAGERGSGMVSHLLTLGRAAEDDVSEHCAGEDLYAPLENITGLARLQLPAHIQLSSDIQAPLPDVACSVMEIEQIMLNLTHNAAAAIKDEGQISVRCAAAPDHALSQPGHPALCLEIHDNGIGIAQEDIDNIFKPFWTSRKGEGGSGLGLAMVQRIVKLRHGCLERSEE